MSVHDRKNLKSALESAILYLQKQGVEEARQDAWLLLEHVCGISHSTYFVHSEDEMPKEQQEQYEALVRKRGEHIPLQRGRSLQFDKRVSEDGAAAHVCVDGLLALAAEALDCLRGLRVRPRGLQGCRNGSGTGLKFRYAGLETGNLGVLFRCGTLGVRGVLLDVLVGLVSDFKRRQHGRGGPHPALRRHRRQADEGHPGGGKGDQSGSDRRARGA